MASSSIVSISIKAQDDASAVIERLGKVFGTSVKTIQQSSSGMTTSISALNSALGAIGVGAGLAGIAQLGKSAFEAGADLERLTKAFQAISGTNTGAQSTLSFLRAEANRLGMEFTSSAQAFKGFSAAAKDSALSTKQVQEVFTSVGEASTVLGLSADQTQGALTALEQMLSKGKVQAEELRGQLGERLPGAFSIAAKSMGMTTAELDKALRDGKVYAEDFLPKFAKALHEKYGEAAKNASNTAVAGLNRFKNAWNELLALTAQKGGLMGAVGSATQYLIADMKSVQSLVEDINNLPYSGSFFNDMIQDAKAAGKVVEFLKNAATNKDGTKQYYGSSKKSPDLTSVASLGRIEADMAVESFSKLETYISKVRDNLKQLQIDRQKVNYEMAQLLGPDTQSNFDVRPPLETDSDYAKRIADLYGTRKDLSGQILNIETQIASKEKEMSGLDLNIDMDRYRQLQEEVSNLQATYGTWYEQIQKVQSEMEWTVDARMSKMDQEEARLQKLSEQYQSMYDEISKTIPLSIDTSAAVQSLVQVGDMISELRAMASQTYTLEMMMARSPAKEWHIGYSEFLSELQSIPTGSIYTLDVLSKYGISGPGSGDVIRNYSSLSSLQSQLDQATKLYEYYSSSWSNPMADYYLNEAIPLLQEKISQANIELMSSFASAQAQNDGSASPGYSSGGITVELNINTIEVNAKASGSGRDFAVSTAVALDGELASLWKDKRSKLRSAIEKGLSG